MNNNDDHRENPPSRSSSGSFAQSANAPDDEDVIIRQLQNKAIKKARSFLVSKTHDFIASLRKEEFQTDPDYEDLGPPDGCLVFTVEMEGCEFDFMAFTYKEEDGSYTVDNNLVLDGEGVMLCSPETLSVDQNNNWLRYGKPISSEDLIP